MHLPLEKLVAEEISLHNPPDVTYVVACSGGLDSMCLAHILYSLGASLALAHVNYGLRGEDSDGDEALVKAWAKNRNLPFYLKTVPPATLCNPGESIQMAARRWRYTWLEEIRTSLPSASIVTAHHLDDSIETFFLNTLRGSGIKGLAGIRNSAPKLLRPFRNVPRAMLVDYAKENQLTWREDASNATDKYDRNYLRLEVLPALGQRFPAYREGIRKTMAHLEELMPFQHWAIKHWKTMAWFEHHQGVTIQPSAFESLPFARLLLVEWLQPLGFHPDQCTQLLDAQCNSEFSSTEWTLYKGQSTWQLRRKYPKQAEDFFIPREAGIYTTPEGHQVEISIQESYEGPPPSDPYTCSIDASWLPHNASFVFRHWVEGDRIQPLGMNGKHQKIHDVLSNARIPAYEKQKRILEINGTIIWVPGLKRSIHGILGPASQKVVTIVWQPSATF